MERYIALTAIVKEGSFTKASEKLGYTQSALSQMVSSLEKELGIYLLIRSHSGAKLSPDGKKIFPIISQTVKSYMMIHNKANEIAGFENNIINISCFSSVSISWMPKIIAGFRQRYPGARFTVDVADDSYNLNSVLLGNSDMALTTINTVKELKYIHLCDEANMVAFPKEHPLTVFESVSFEELVKYPFISNDFAVPGDAVSVIQSMGYNPNVIVRTENNESVLRMVENGLGVAIIPKQSLTVENEKLEFRPLNPEISRSIYIAYKGRQNLSYASLRFLEYVVSTAPKLF